MLLSIALILIIGLALSWLSKKIKLPGLVGMILTGIILGPYVLNLLDPAILNISSHIRKIALVIILIRAGLTLDVSGLKKIGRPAILMCFLPATFELGGMLIMGPVLLHLSLLESALLGAVLAAVSPAVVVPRMIRLIEEGYGTDKGIPQLILAGASVDDVYVIVLFTTFLGMFQGEKASVIDFVNIPVSIVLGILIGSAAGMILSWLFDRVSSSCTVKAITLLSVSLLLVAAEDYLNTPITFASLISVMFIGSALKKRQENTAKELSSIFNKLWTGAEVFLFVLVGATVDITYLGKVGVGALLVIAGALVFRMLGVMVCLLGSHMTFKEKLFTMMAYTPKATVQAAIGGIPLAAGLECGNTVLIVAVLAILITAPVGAFAIDNSYTKLLEVSHN